LVVGATTVVNAESLRVFNGVKKPLVYKLRGANLNFIQDSYWLPSGGILSRIEV
jgi:hypothetical protein